MTIGLETAPRAIAPKVTGNEVRFPAVFPQSRPRLRRHAHAAQRKDRPDRAADGRRAGHVHLQPGPRRRHRRGPAGRLDRVPRAPTATPPLFYLPKPFMYDSTDDPPLATGTGWSDKVTQTLAAATGSDHHRRRELARSPDRRYPVVIDPTIKVQPQVGQAQDAMINSYEPGTNYDSLWRLSVGTNQVNATTKAIFRSLVKFPLTEVPPGTTLDSAQLRLYFDQTMVNANDPDAVPIQAHRVTAPLGREHRHLEHHQRRARRVGQNTEQVDNADSGKTAAAGEWPAARQQRGARRLATGSTGRDHRRHVHLGATGHRAGQLRGPGPLRARRRPGDQRAVRRPPRRRRHDERQVNQTTGSGNGNWVSIGAYTFNAGTTHKVVLGDVANKVVVADGVRLIKRAADTKDAAAATRLAQLQRPLDRAGLARRHAAQLRLHGEGRRRDRRARAGPRYEGAENAYGGEVDTLPDAAADLGPARRDAADADHHPVHRRRAVLERVRRPVAGSTAPTTSSSTRCTAAPRRASSRRPRTLVAPVVEGTHQLQRHQRHTHAGQLADRVRRAVLLHDRGEDPRRAADPVAHRAGAAAQGRPHRASPAGQRHRHHADQRCSPTPGTTCSTAAA